MGLFIKIDKERIRKEYKVLSPTFPTLGKISLRVIRLNRLIDKKTHKVIEVDPTSLGKHCKCHLEIGRESKKA